MLRVNQFRVVTSLQGARLCVPTLSGSGDTTTCRESETEELGTGGKTRLSLEVDQSSLSRTVVRSLRRGPGDAGAGLGRLIRTRSGHRVDGGNRFGRTEEAERDRLPDQAGIEFGCGVDLVLVVVLLFLGSALLDYFAEGAGVLPIEGLRHGFLD